LANLTVSLHVARREKCWRIHTLSAAFSVLHFSYGIGFLLGLIKFWNRWGEDDEWSGEAMRQAQDGQQVPATAVKN
jgi:hypothetical protein